MSRRTADASKAIRLAWEQEQQRVLVGEGTRDWTKEQQQDIINKGKAYDDDGKAFEGQHMKSAAEYPEHQGNPNNIQFLTHQEHFEAHKGNWQNPTNWYYDPVTKEYFDFGEGDFIPCKVIKLSDPICSIDNIALENEENDAVETVNQCQNKYISENQYVSLDSSENVSQTPVVTQPPISGTTISKSKSLFEKIRHFFTNHPGLVNGLKTTGKALLAIGGVAVAYAVGKGSSNSSSNGSSESNDYRDDYFPLGSDDEYIEPQSDNNETYEEIEDSEERSSPEKHMVSAHGQHYHTRNGLIWKEKDSYSRGGKKEDDHD